MKFILGRIPTVNLIISIILFMVLLLATSHAMMVEVRSGYLVSDLEENIYLFDKNNSRLHKLNDIDTYTSNTVACINKYIDTETEINITGELTDYSASCSVNKPSHNDADHDLYRNFMGILWGTDITVFINNGAECSESESVCIGDHSSLFMDLDIDTIEYYFDEKNKFSSVNIYSSKPDKIMNYLTQLTKSHSRSDCVLNHDGYKLLITYDYLDDGVMVTTIEYNNLTVF